MAKAQGNMSAAIDWLNKYLDLFMADHEAWRELAEYMFPCKYLDFDIRDDENEHSDGGWRRWRKEPHGPKFAVLKLSNNSWIQKSGSGGLCLNGGITIALMDTTNLMLSEAEASEKMTVIMANWNGHNDWLY
ncbi:hypothetical protein HAX54_042395 [Datura stramonium]|uniref:EMC2 TPR-like domain-containing protein n=1 Tax=Datura stramonium TaxID=4076 RepID=A0ABS8SM69_DATST|nr:hypothetical protein [Datura stramonium]